MGFWPKVKSLCGLLARVKNLSVALVARVEDLCGFLARVKIAGGHTGLKIPDLFRPLRSNNPGPGWYCDGGPLGKTNVLTAVKQPRAWLILWWGTAWKDLGAASFCYFFGA